MVVACSPFQVTGKSKTDAADETWVALEVVDVGCDVISFDVVSAVDAVCDAVVVVPVTCGVVTNVLALRPKNHHDQIATSPTGINFMNDLLLSCMS